MINPTRMRNTLLFALLISLINVNTLFAVAGDSEEGGQINTKEEINEYIQHHLQDSHDFIFWTSGKTGTHYGFPLPVILWSDGVHVFSSSKFDHGHEVAESNGKYFALYHGKVYETNAEGDIELDEAGHPTNPKPLDLSITKNVVGMLLASLLLFLGFNSLARSYRTRSIPKGIGRILEPLVIYVRDEIARPNIGPKYERYMFYLLTVFFYIWILNLMGLTPLGFNVTGNIAITVGLALITFVVVQFSGNKNYWKHIFWMPGVPIPMKIILMPIEVLGMFTKPFALLIRLFANITAGHFVVMSLIALMITMKSAFGLVASTGMAFALAFFITIIELLVAFLQAYIFTMLSALFIGMAVEEEHH
ncbi:ATP synthase subunit a [Marivirga tractuosa]|uniref:ATP synthase subunit a n=2 Tax=Marivirga TaxID=869806 RepID=E4TNY1_MARTH|nr:ATP synthase F0 subcomplex A subunit [Marivirga tractuosa DSM 4126]BDD16784.1 ATP synthase subunit a [Marivirga tractuosa]